MKTIFGALVALGLITAAIAGWLMNIMAIFDMWHDTITAELIIRLLGVPVGIIGMVAGYL